MGNWLRVVAFCGVVCVGGPSAVGDVLGVGSSWDASGLGYFFPGGDLENNAECGWWYGCSATAAGMMMGYYDRNGYGGYSYAGLVPGGVAEDLAWGVWPAGSLIRTIMASEGHQRDFYSASTYGYNTGGGSGYGYGTSHDDSTGPLHSFDSLADFMGTNQDSAGNSNGRTMFYHWQNGAKLFDYQLTAYNLQDKDGMYGLGEYLAYIGYSHTYNGLYTQPTDNLGLTYGFSFADYMAEIDAGRPVMIHTANHSVYGYGYDALSQSVYLYDTWSAGAHTMAWGGSYGGASMVGVTALELSGGDPVPEPSRVAVWSLLAAMPLVIRWRRHEA